MGLYWKAAAAVLVAVVLILALGRKDLGLVLGIAACAMVSLAALEYLEPVTELFDTLETLGDLESGMISILLKSVGIGVLTEIAAMVCTDSGNGSLGKALQLLGTAVILWISLPLFTALLDLIQEIMGNL